MTRRKTCLSAALLVFVAGCNDPTPITSALPTPTPTIVPAPSPTPSPTPTPEPSPSNRSPTVTIRSTGDCHPSPNRPCSVQFTATASDPDGDRLAFGWDGCAQGNAPTATCTIAAPGQFTAIVLVDDLHGGGARAVANVQGVNTPPRVPLPNSLPPNPAPPNTFYSLIGRVPADPEGDDDEAQLCQRTRLVLTGPCRGAIGHCGGTRELEIDFRTLQGPGTCTFELQATDVWGAIGIGRVHFDVLP